MHISMRIFEDILNIVFPKVCCTCDQGLTKNEELICFHCRSTLPKAKFADLKDNEVVHRMYGKLDVVMGLSYLYFYKSGIAQKLLHQLKYKNQPEIGELLGNWIAYDIMNARMEKTLDLIVPVPLHKKKERKRGYNQSRHFAKGISELTKIPMDFHNLHRIHYSESQTHKSKEKRWKSVEHAFRVKTAECFKDKHVLLVDDVMTTGATLEACGKEILKNGASALSIATIALAK